MDVLGRAVGPDKRCQFVVHPADEERIVGLVPAHGPNTSAHRMVRQPYSLGKVRLKHEAEGSLRAHSIDCHPQVGAQNWVVDLLEENV